MCAQATGSRIVMINPVADAGIPASEVAPRIGGLNDKAMGFLYNGHYSAPVLFDAVRQKLTEKFKFSSVVDKVKPNVGAPSPDATIDEVAAKCDAVVLGVGA
ncbi:MAG: hypothetical protein HYX92_07230 [Chloroflexi bacterium]|nr:hypothetical protein [Chloroflexota bacterium]